MGPGLVTTIQPSLPSGVGQRIDIVNGLSEAVMFMLLPALHMVDCLA
jgi:hypothetical protein